MGRKRVSISGNRFLIVGYDGPMETLYAQLYDEGDHPGAAPTRAIGYHPAERDPRERTEHGCYPADFGDIDRALQDWGLTGEERESVGRAIASDPNLPGPGP